MGFTVANMGTVGLSAHYSENRGRREGLLFLVKSKRMKLAESWLCLSWQRAKQDSERIWMTHDKKEVMF